MVKVNVLFNLLFWTKMWTIACLLIAYMVQTIQHTSGVMINIVAFWLSFFSLFWQEFFIPLRCLYLILYLFWTPYAASNLFKMLLKYRPEDKAAKKERLLRKAQAETEGKTVEAKKPIVVKYGLNHITYLIEQVAHQFILHKLVVRTSPLSCWNSFNNIFSLYLFLAEKSPVGCYCSWCGPHWVGCMATSFVQEDGNPVLHCEGKISIGSSKCACTFAV